MKKNINDLQSKFYVGQKVSVKRIVGKDDVEKIAELTGDFNGLHLNDELAKKSIFGNGVCHGMLISSYISAVLGTCLSGEGTIYLSQDLQFRKPIYINEAIEITVEVEKIIEEKSIICLNTVVTKSDGVSAISGNARVKFIEIV